MSNDPFAKTNKRMDWIETWTLIQPNKSCVYSKVCDRYACQDFIYWSSVRPDDTKIMLILFQQEGPKQKRSQLVHHVFELNAKQCSVKGSEMSSISTSLAVLGRKKTVSPTTCSCMRGRRECEGQALHGLSETPSKCTTRPFLNSAIVIWRCRIKFPSFTIPLAASLFPNPLLQGKDDWENKKGGTHKREARFS